DFGVLFADMDVSAEEEVPSERLLQPKAEAEIAFVLGHDLVDDDFSADDVRGAVDYAVAALEIVDSRIANWDLAITDTVADNASSGVFVLGTKRFSLCDFDPRNATMHMYINDNLVSEGSGSACLGDPLNVLAWLARTAASFGDPLRAGQIILSGALGPMVATPPAPGSEPKSRHWAECRRRSRARSGHDEVQSGHHRIRQYRHRLDDQDSAHLRESRGRSDGRYRPQLRWVGSREAVRNSRHPRGRRRPSRDAQL